MPDRETSKAELVLNEIMAKVNTGRIHIYHNALRRPYIFFDVPDRPGGCFHVFEEEVCHWIASYAFDLGIGVLHEREIKRILFVLAGRAQKDRLGSVSDPQLLQLVESEPVLAVIVEFMHTNPKNPFTTTMDPLWKELRKFAEDRHLLKLGRRRFPGGSNVLSRQLRHFEPSLRLLGVDVLIKRSDGSNVTLRRLDDTKDQSSVEPSDRNANSDFALNTKDDLTGRVARLQAKQDQQKSE